MSNYSGKDVQPSTIESSYLWHRLPRSVIDKNFVDALLEYYEPNEKEEFEHFFDPKATICIRSNKTLLNELREIFQNIVNTDINTSPLEDILLEATTAGYDLIKSEGVRILNVDLYTIDGRHISVDVVTGADLNKLGYDVESFPIADDVAFAPPGSYDLNARLSEQLEKNNREVQDNQPVAS